MMSVVRRSLDRIGSIASSRPVNAITVMTLSSIACALAMLAVILGLPGSAEASAPSEYYSRLRLRACRQLLEGRASIELTYRLNGSGPRQPVPILSQSLSHSSGEVTLYFTLPRTLGVHRMHLEAFCRSGAELSPPSNQIAVSNCDFLATEDNDRDGLPNSAEDTNCDNFFSPGDLSNPDNVDTDGDGVRDLVERIEGFDPTNPGSSPRPYIFSGSSFDPDGDGNSNPVVWRKRNGTWYIRDFTRPGYHLGVQFGLPGDTPFTYQPLGHTSNVGVVRRFGSDLVWILNGPGIRFSDGHYERIRSFGLFGDNLIPGPWERRGETNLAVARLFNGYWTFFILQSDGSVRQVVWGGNGDIPKVQDYDGDGIFDVAVFRPSEGTYYVIRSRDGGASVVQFGSGTADHTVRGDYDGDGSHDFISWEPQNGMFTAMRSERSAGADHFAMQLGLYYVHLPLSWNHQYGQDLLTVVEHASGFRYVRPSNNPSEAPLAIQWGLAGDAQG